MPLLNEDSLAAEAQKRASYRLVGVTTKLSPREVADVERLAKGRGQQRGELIRQLIRNELAKGADTSIASTELTEIMGTDAEALEAQLIENLQRRDVHPLQEAQGSLVVLHPDNRVVELSFVSFIPFILCRGRSLSEPAALRRRTNASCGFTPPKAD